MAASGFSCFVVLQALQWIKAMYLPIVLTLICVAVRAASARMQARAAALRCRMLASHCAVDAVRYPYRHTRNGMRRLLLVNLRKRFFFRSQKSGCTNLTGVG